MLWIVTLLQTNILHESYLSGWLMSTFVNPVATAANKVGVALPPFVLARACPNTATSCFRTFGPFFGTIGFAAPIQ